MGRCFPEGNLFFEHQRAAVPDPFAADQRHMTPEDAAGDAKDRHRLAHLYLDAHARQEPPVGFDERAARRQIDNLRRTPWAEPRPVHTGGRQAGDSRRRATLACYRASHVRAPTLNSKMRVRPVAPSTRTAN